MFDRQNYYSQTEACKLFKITPATFKKLIDGLPMVKNPVTLHTPIEALPYQVNAVYVTKEDFDNVVKKVVEDMVTDGGDKDKIVHKILEKKSS